MNSALLTYLAESSFCLALFYVFYLVALRTETGFRYNRYYLLGALLLSFLAPLLPIPGLLPTIQENISLQPVALEGAALTAAELQAIQMKPETPIINYWYLVYGLYSAGVLFFFARLVQQLLSLRSFMHQRANHLQEWENVPVILTDGQLPTFSFLNYIFFDNSQPLTLQEQTRILQHEKAHLEQKHSYDLLFIQVLQIIFWFNPLLLLYRKALTQTHEFLADAQVIQHANKEEYSTLLLQQVFQQMGFALGHSFFKQKSFTLKRIQMMSKSNQTPNRLKYALVAPLVGCMLLGLSAHRPAEVKAKLVSAVEQPRTAPVNSGITDRAQFPGGTEAAIQFLADHLAVPAATFKKAGEEKFTMVWEVEIQINADGSAQYLETTALDTRPNTPEVKEAIKQAGIQSISKMPKWKPAVQAGAPVTSKEKVKFAKVLAAHPTTATPTLAASVISLQDDEKVFIAVEDPAEFPGGKQKMYEYLQENIKFTEALKSENVTGMAITSFVINKEGKVVRPELIKKIHPELDAQILKALEEMPDWKPGKQNGKPVAQKFIIPYRIGAAKESTTSDAQTGEDKVYIAVEDPAEFPGGQPALYRYLQDKIQFPAELKDKNVTGTAIVSFIISKEGKVTQPKITTSVHPLLDAQILKALEGMPQWKPAKQNGKIVLQKFQLPYRIEAAKK